MLTYDTLVRSPFRNEWLIFPAGRSVAGSLLSDVKVLSGLFWFKKATWPKVFPPGTSCTKRLAHTCQEDSGERSQLQNSPYNQLKLPSRSHSATFPSALSCSLPFHSTRTNSRSQLCDNLPQSWLPKETQAATIVFIRLLIFLLFLVS